MPDMNMPATGSHETLLQLTRSIRELHASQQHLQAMMERLVLAQERSLDMQNRMMGNQTQILEETRHLGRFVEHTREQQAWNERQDQTNLILLDEVRALRHALRELPEHLGPRLGRLESFFAPPGSAA